MADRESLSSSLYLLIAVHTLQVIANSVVLQTNLFKRPKFQHINLNIEESHADAHKKGIKDIVFSSYTMRHLWIMYGCNGSSCQHDGAVSPSPPFLNQNNTLKLILNSYSITQGNLCLGNKVLNVIVVAEQFCCIWFKDLSSVWLCLHGYKKWNRNVKYY